MERNEMNEVTQIEAVAHDEKMLDLYAAALRATKNYAWRCHLARQAVGTAGQAKPTLNEAIARLEALVAAGEETYSQKPSTLLAQMIDAREASNDATTALSIHEAGYTGWSRYLLVTSSDGHIHRSMTCHTCNKGATATTFGMLPRLSGTSTDVAVEVLGSALCSVCFSDAPVDQLEQVRVPARIAMILVNEGEQAFIKARNEYAAKSAAKAAERCSGSGTYNTVPGSWVNRYPSPCATCVKCNGRVSLTSTGKMRAHKAVA